MGKLAYVGIVVRLATLIIGTAYPAYKSVEALESKATVDDSQWLTYWLLSAVITLLERILSPAIPYVPLYPIIKCAFLCWLVLPQTKGTEALYRQARPGLLFLKHHFDLILGKDVAAANLGQKDVTEQLKGSADDAFSVLHEAVGKQNHTQ